MFLEFIIKLTVYTRYYKSYISVPLDLKETALAGVRRSQAYIESMNWNRIANRLFHDKKHCQI